MEEERIFDEKTGERIQSPKTEGKEVIVSPEEEDSLDSQKTREKIRNYLSELEKTTPSTPLASRDEAKEISKFTHSQQVSALIALVFEKGLQQAIAVAKSLDNPAILDEFHDVLVNRHKDELIKKGVIKKEDM